MKYTTITTLAALLLGTAGTFAQTTAHTKPAGFVTHTLKAGQFNLIGLTLHKSIIASGAFDTVSGTTLTDNDLNFGTTLTAGKTYILEIIDAADTSLNGTIQEVTAWSGNTITTPQDLDVDGLAAGDKYQMRAACTIADVFGAANEAGIQGGGSASVADNIYLPTSVGFDIYYYSTGGFFGVGWRKVGSTNTDFSSQPIILTDGFYVFRRASANINLVNTGAVKVKDTTLAITKEYTRVSGVFPVGSTFDSSKMKDSLTGGGSASVADQVIIQNASGGFDFYYYSTGGFFGVGWRKVGATSVDQSSVELPSAFIIKRYNSNDFNLKLTKPLGYENL